jgi:Tol biopolymer transport system component
MMQGKVPLYILAVLTLIFCTSCSENIVIPPDTPNIPRPIYPQPYSDPSWSFDGQKIFFYRKKIDKISPSGFFSTVIDSSGIWQINRDGTQMKLIWQGLDFHSPSLSPDNKWLLFGRNGNIFKVLIEDDVIDTSSTLQLTNDGNYLNPKWSYDGLWIAYTNIIGDTVGIWISPSDGSRVKSYFTIGGSPRWTPNSEALIYVRNGLWIETRDHTDKFHFYPYNPNIISTLSISYDSNWAVFDLLLPNHSAFDIWIIRTDGQNLNQLSSHAATQPDISKYDEIVYVHYDETNYDITNGTLWIMDKNGSDKRQLTFNHNLIFDF